ncbi:hypothetical protein DFH07DRAFT_773701 [Mycena maculata]|uniref:Uncharacterized protein n=1 Tax=Mycena maculata TaxID=230809 RepID=A0AAD7NCQ1_9AGAR|nr:hypothetical protein DFH07DRAFT_773701 [Mycena maculata]
MNDSPDLMHLGVDKIQNKGSDGRLDGVERGRNKMNEQVNEAGNAGTGRSPESAGRSDVVIVTAAGICSIRGQDMQCEILSVLETRRWEGVDAEGGDGAGDLAQGTRMTRFGVQCIREILFFRCSRRERGGFTPWGRGGELGTSAKEEILLRSCFNVQPWIGLSIFMTSTDSHENASGGPTADAGAKSTIETAMWLSSFVDLTVQGKIILNARQCVPGHDEHRLQRG